MVTITTSYEGQLHCKAVHEPSGKKLETDAPVDNHGRGETFSPTDLVATALGTCYLTIMGIQAESHNINMKGTKVTVIKEMTAEQPRRIARLIAKVDFCKGIPFNKRGLFEAVALNCPTSKSLHPDVKIENEFNFPD